MSRQATDPEPASVTVLALDTHEPEAANTRRPSSQSRQRGRIEPLSADHYLMKVTIDRGLKNQIELARDLLSHANPSGDLVEVVRRAITLLIERLEAKRKGHSKRTHSVEPTQNAQKSSRYVARAVRREVVARDGWRCSFVSADGHRCESRAFLEFDHIYPHARRGASIPANLRLFCRAHNRLAAEVAFGERFVRDTIEKSQRAHDSQDEPAKTDPTLVVKDRSRARYQPSRHRYCSKAFEVEAFASH